MQSKRPYPFGDDHDVPMRKFKRPHSSTAYSSGLESSKFALNVLICKPQFGKHHHWALQLHNLATDDGTIFEIQGARPSYEFATYQCRSKYYALQILKTIGLGQLTLSSSGLESIAHAIENEVSVRNDQADWTGQDYVFDVLEMLEEEWWLDIDDNEYMDVKEKLKGMRGPIDMVQKAVSTYSATSRSSKDVVESTDEEQTLEPRRTRTVQFAEMPDAG